LTTSRGAGFYRPDVLPVNRVPKPPGLESPGFLFVKFPCPGKSRFSSGIGGGPEGNWMIPVHPVTAVKTIVVVVLENGFGPGKS